MILSYGDFQELSMRELAARLEMAMGKAMREKDQGLFSLYNGIGKRLPDRMPVKLKERAFAMIRAVDIEDSDAAKLKANGLDSDAIKKLVEMAPDPDAIKKLREAGLDAEAIKKLREKALDSEAAKSVLFYLNLNRLVATAAPYLVVHGRLDPDEIMRTAIQTSMEAISRHKDLKGNNVSQDMGKKIRGGIEDYIADSEEKLPDDSMWARSRLPKSVTEEATSNPEEIVISKETTIIVRDVMKILRPVEERVLKTRYIEDDATLQEAGNAFGVTRERIRQIEEKAFKNLRRGIAMVQLDTLKSKKEKKLKDKS